MTGYVRYNVRKISKKKMLQPLRLQHFFSLLCEYFLLVHRRFLLFLIMNKSLLSSIIYYNFSTITIAFLTSFLILEFKRKLPVFSSDSFPFLLILLETLLLPAYSSLYPKDHTFLNYLFPLILLQ